MLIFSNEKKCGEMGVVSMWISGVIPVTSVVSRFVQAMRTMIVMLDDD